MDLRLSKEYVFLYNLFFCNGLMSSNDGNLIFGSRTFKLKIFPSTSGIEFERFDLIASLRNLLLWRWSCIGFDVVLVSGVVGGTEFSASICKYLKLRKSDIFFRSRSSFQSFIKYFELSIFFFFISWKFAVPFIYLKELGGLSVLFLLPKRIRSFSRGVNGLWVCNGFNVVDAKELSVICDSRKTFLLPCT